uniref:ParB/Sulfiredoxin domain-containing protein n=1 Tax=viral metagenome TaxID=1070528 RepID=A0A6C0B879_9ZZZZ
MDFTSVERNYLDTHSYKIEQLWECAKNKPIINLPISAFNNSLSSKYWDDKEGNDISPYEVLANPKKAPYHIEAINKADLNYPLIVSESNLDVLDGLHRLCRSILLQKTNIDVQKISVSDLKKCIGVVQMQRSKSKSLTDGKKKIKTSKKKIKTSKKKIKTKNKIISLKNKKNKFLIGVLNR